MFNTAFTGQYLCQCDIQCPVFFRKTCLFTDVFADVFAGRLCKTKDSEGRSYSMSHGGEIIQKFGKGNVSALSSTETDNIIDSRLVGNGSWEKLWLINICRWKDTTSFWQKAFLNICELIRLNYIQGTAVLTAWKIKLILIMNTENWMNIGCWNVLIPNPV